MRTVDANPGATIRWEEGEFYFHASATIDGESLAIRVPLGDGRYHAQIVVERIVLPAIAWRPLDQAPEPAPVDFSDI
jgi:hypothetical protein